MAEKPIRIGPVAPLTTASTYYTVPAGTITILRSIHIANGSSTAIVSITRAIFTVEPAPFLCFSAPSRPATGPGG